MVSPLGRVVYPLTVLKLFRSAVTLVNLFKTGKSEGSTSERCGIFTLWSKTKGCCCCARVVE